MMRSCSRLAHPTRMPAPDVRAAGRHRWLIDPDAKLGSCTRAIHGLNRAADRDTVNPSALFAGPQCLLTKSHR